MANEQRKRPRTTDVYSPAGDRLSRSYDYGSRKREENIVEGLPWIVVSGGALWRGLLVLAAFSGPIVFLWISQRRARRNAVAQRARLEKPTDTLERSSAGEEAVVRGELATSMSPQVLFEGEPAAAIVTITDREGSAQISRHVDGLALKVGKAEVALEGQVKVTAGSLERFTSPSDDAEVEEELEGSSKLRITRLLQAGDRVRCRGRLKLIGADEDRGSYRESAGRWVLEPVDDDEESSLVAAYEGRPRFRRPVVAAMVASVIIGALASFGLLYGIGWACNLYADWRLDRLRAAASEGDFCRDEVTLPTAIIAAATPAREQALENLDRALGYDTCLIGDQLERAAALRTLLGRCPAALFAQHGRLERAVEVAERCEPTAQRMRERARFALGRFEASDADVLDESCYPRGLGVQQHLIVGDYDGARRAAKTCVESLEEAHRENEASRQKRLAENPSDSVIRIIESPRSREKLERDVMGCIESWSGVRAEREGALQELQKRAAEQPVCRPLLIDVGGEVGELEAFEGEDARFEPLREWMEVLLAVEGDPGAVRYREVPWGFLDTFSMTGPGFPGEDLLENYRFTGLEREALGVLDSIDPVNQDAAMLRAHLHLNAAVYALREGDFEAARRERAAAQSDVNRFPEAHYFFELRVRVRELAVFLELEAGREEAAQQAISRLTDRDSPYERENALAILELREQGSTSRDVPLLHLDGLGPLTSGDGEVMARFLRDRGRSMRWSVRYWLPGVRSGQSELVEVLRTGYDGPGLCDSLVRCLAEAKEDVARARALDDEVWEREARPRLERLSAAIAQREAAVPLAFLELIH